MVNPNLIKYVTYNTSNNMLDNADGIISFKWMVN